MVNSMQFWKLVESLMQRINCLCIKYNLNNIFPEWHLYIKVFNMQTLQVMGNFTFMFDMQYKVAHVCKWLQDQGQGL